MEENKKEKKDEFEFKGSYQKKYENIKNLIQASLNHMEKVKNAIDLMEQEERKAHYQSVPGTEGVFDGQYLIAQDGRKTEVPANYAAKSKLVYGDILKVFTDSGKQIFKQIDKVERKQVEGVLAKKEGKWYLLSDDGSYKISDISAEYNNAELNDKAVALIPKENSKVPFAALDKVLKDSTAAKLPEKPEKKDIKVERKPKPKRSKNENKSSESGGVAVIKKDKDTKPKNIKKEEKIAPQKQSTDEKVQKEYINNIMDDDDLR
jgi:hypothetical protein